MMEENGQIVDVRIESGFNSLVLGHSCKIEIIEYLFFFWYKRRKFIPLLLRYSNKNNL